MHVGIYLEITAGFSWGILVLEVFGASRTEGLDRWAWLTARCFRGATTSSPSHLSLVRHWEQFKPKFCAEICSPELRCLFVPAPERRAIPSLSCGSSANPTQIWCPQCPGRQGWWSLPSYRQVHEGEFGKKQWLRNVCRFYPCPSKQTNTAAALQWALCHFSA